MPKEVITLKARAKRRMTDEEKAARKETLEANKRARAERAAEYEARASGALKDPEVTLPDDLTLAPDQDLIAATVAALHASNALRAHGKHDTEEYRAAEAELATLRAEAKRRRAAKDLVDKEAARVKAEAAFDARKAKAIADPDNFRKHLNKTVKDLKWWETEGKLQAEVALKKRQQAQPK